MTRGYILLSDNITTAFLRYKREDFLPKDVRSQASIDAPLPIGYDQTNSQPSTVRQMLEWLDVQAGQRVLDVGSGSGWTSALLSHIVGDRGEVFAVEKVPELVSFGQHNCSKLNIRNVSFHQSDSIVGLPEHAPYDRILVSAAARELPDELVLQLAVGGRMVIPVEEDICVITKQTENDIVIENHSGYAFVPLL